MSGGVLDESQRYRFFSPSEKEGDTTFIVCTLPNLAKKYKNLQLRRIVEIVLFAYGNVEGE